jgi:hypothetical protein
MASKMSIHHRGPKGTEGFCLFAYREMTIGKNKLSLTGKVVVYIPAASGLIVFVCRRLPANEKIESQRSPCLRGEPILTGVKEIGKGCNES